MSVILFSVGCQFLRLRQIGLRGSWTSWHKASILRIHLLLNSTLRKFFPAARNHGKGWGVKSVIKAVLQIVAGSYDTARIFCCAVEKASIRPETDPVELAFEDLCQRFDLYLSRLRGQGDRQRGLLILDKSTRETSLQRLTREFRNLGTKWGAIHNLADIPFFVDSSASRLVQCADVIAYAVFRRYNSGDAQYFDIIASKFDTADGVLHGLAHKVADNANCMCPACLSRRLGGPTLRRT